MSTQLDMFGPVENPYVIEDQDMAHKFADFDAANPRVYTLFKHFAEQAIARHKHYSADAICHRIRWHTLIDVVGYEDFKINNNYVAFYARKLVNEDTRFAGFFRNRTSRADDTARTQTSAS